MLIIGSIMVSIPQDSITPSVKGSWSGVKSTFPAVANIIPFLCLHFFISYLSLSFFLLRTDLIMLLSYALFCDILCKLAKHQASALWRNLYSGDTLGLN